MQISTNGQSSIESIKVVEDHPCGPGCADSREEQKSAFEFYEHPIKRQTRDLLRRTLSPKAFRVLRYWLWCFRSYIPRLFACRIVSHNPQVRWSSESSPIAQKLQMVNLLAPTKMCRVMTRHGSDKGRAHGYTTVYSALFMGQYREHLRLVELGLGSNNLDVPSNMGVFGAPGASLRGWRELLPNAQIYGADIDRRILFQEDRIKTFHCDQLDKSSVQELWSHPELQNGADIIIEDGLHTYEANVAFLRESLDYLRPGGIYITEDIAWSDADKWFDSLENIFSKQYPNHDFVFLTLPGKYQKSSNLVVIRNTAS